MSFLIGSLPGSAEMARPLRTCRPSRPGLVCSDQPHLLSHPQTSAVPVFSLLIFPWAGPALPPVWEGHPLLTLQLGSQGPNRT